MNVRDYIATGVLQDCCMGLLTIEEEIAMKAMFDVYPELAKELQHLQQALERFAGGNETIRTEQFRTAVWKSVEKLWAE